MATPPAPAPPDLISGLPDEILIHILSLLPSTRLATRTAALSRRFRRLHLHSPALDFPLTDFPDPSAYAATVDLALRRSLAPRLLRFRAHASPLPSPSPADFDRWLRLAAARSVAHLALSFFSAVPHRPDLPVSLLLAAPALRSLKLIRCRFPSSPVVQFPLLTYLYLSTATITDSTLSSLLSACPLLETLYLCNCTGVVRLKISGDVNPLLQSVNLERVTRKSVEELAVDAPGLTMFDFEGNVRKLRVRAGAGLRSAQILSRYWMVYDDMEEWRETVAAVASVEVLSVSCWFFEFTIDEASGLLGSGVPVFKNLRELHWAGVCITEDNLVALVHCLKECPVIDTLCINLDYYEELSKVVAEQNNEDEVVSQNNEDEVVSVEAGQSSIVEDFPTETDQDEGVLEQFDENMVMLSRLKVFTVTQFSDTRYAMQLLEFILRKATNLELLRLTIMPEPEVEFELLHKKLSGFHHASQHVKIEILKLEGNSVPQDHKLFQHLWSF